MRATLSAAIGPYWKKSHNLSTVLTHLEVTGYLPDLCLDVLKSLVPLVKTDIFSCVLAIQMFLFLLLLMYFAMQNWKHLLVKVHLLKIYQHHHQILI